jgi:uncharacterized protein
MEQENCWGFDIDSVVGDLAGILERVAWEVYGIRVSRSQFTRFRLEECLPYDPELIAAWLSVALERSWTAQMEPYPGAVEVLSELATCQPLRFVTARPEAGPIREWLVRHLGEVANEQIRLCAVGNAELKASVLLNWGVSHFVEDHMETCEILHQKGIVPIVFEQPWNTGQRRFATVRSWIEIRDYIFSERLIKGGLNAEVEN